MPAYLGGLGPGTLLRRRTVVFRHSGCLLEDIDKFSGLGAVLWLLSDLGERKDQVVETDCGRGRKEEGSRRRERTQRGVKVKCETLCSGVKRKDLGTAGSVDLEEVS